MNEIVRTSEKEHSAWAVVYADIGEGFDGHPQVLGVYKTYEEALKALRDDMNHIKGIRTDELVYDFDAFEIRNANENDPEFLCAYNIVEIELP